MSPVTLAHGIVTRVTRVTAPLAEPEVHQTFYCSSRQRPPDPFHDSADGCLNAGCLDAATWPHGLGVSFGSGEFTNRCERSVERLEPRLGRYAESGMILKLGIALEGPWRSVRRAGAARGE